MADAPKVAGKLGKGAEAPKGNGPSHTPKPTGGDADVAKTKR